ncbi:MAG: hypothetical protein QOG59_2431, partial [Solirubrobacteraceae bacterium]|nr:hypothetical protein [Solirubrobacteraceae bacterium]
LRGETNKELEATITQRDRAERRTREAIERYELETVGRERAEAQIEELEAELERARWAIDETRRELERVARAQRDDQVELERITAAAEARARDLAQAEIDSVVRSLALESDQTGHQGEEPE